MPLNDKPIASPFAFYGCGLIVPVYPKMRSLLVHGWNEPEDAISNGFVWTSDMTPPKTNAGDWRLCLPTKLDGDGKPTGTTVDDLTSQDGQRIIRAQGHDHQHRFGSAYRRRRVGRRPAAMNRWPSSLRRQQDHGHLEGGCHIEMTDGVRLRLGRSVTGGKVSTLARPIS